MWPLTSNPLAACFRHHICYQVESHSENLVYAVKVFEKGRDA